MGGIITLLLLLTVGRFQLLSIANRSSQMNLQEGKEPGLQLLVAVENDTEAVVESVQGDDTLAFDVRAPVDVEQALDYNGPNARGQSDRERKQSAASIKHQRLSGFSLSPYLLAFWPLLHFFSESKYSNLAGKFSVSPKRMKYFFFIRCNMKEKEKGGRALFSFTVARRNLQRPVNVSPSVCEDCPAARCRCR